MKRRFFAWALICALLLSVFPQGAVAAAAQDRGGVTLTGFDICINGEESRRTSLLGKENPEIVRMAGESYFFDVSFSDNSTISSVYVTSTTEEGIASLPAVYDFSSETYRTSGWFLDDSTYVPGTLRVRYVEHAPAVEVSGKFDTAPYRIPGLTEEHITATVTNGGNTVDAKILLDGITEEIVDTALGVSVDLFDENADASLDDWLGSYKDYAGWLTYHVTGEGGEEYDLHLDYSDPSTYTLIVKRISNNEIIKVVVDATSDKIPVKSLRNVAEHLSEIGTISKTLVEVSGIEDDCDELREKVEANLNLTAVQMDEAYRKIDQLEQDRHMFALISASIPMLVTVGAAGGPPGIIMSALLAMINGSASYFWELRMAGVVAGEVAAEFVTAGYCGVDDNSTPDVDEYQNVMWTLNGGTLRIMGTGYMRAPDLLTTEAIESVTRIVVDPGVKNAIFYMPGRARMSNVREVSLAASVEEVSSLCFSGFSSLKSITLPEGVELLGGWAFRDCTALKEIRLPASLSTVGGGAFYNCESLERIYIRGDNPLSFDDNGFPRDLPVQFVFADGPRDIITLDSRGCIASDVLTNDTLSPVHHTAYYTYGDPKWTALKDAQQNKTHHFTIVALGGPSGNCGPDQQWAMDLEGNLTLSGTGDMKLRRTAPWILVDNLSTLTVKEGVTGIDDNAFEGCAGLISVTLPDSLARIGDDAFNGCSGLQTIMIPKNARIEGNSDFSGCTKLNWIGVNSANTKYRSVDGIFYEQAYGQYGGWMLSRCPEGRVGTVAIPDGVTTIRYNAFRDCIRVTAVSIPESVVSLQSLGDGIFSGSGVRDIYYAGTAQQWERMDPDGSILGSINLHCRETRISLAVQTLAGEGTVWGGGLYAVGEEVSVEAYAEPGYTFLHWVDGEGVILSEESSYTFTLYDSAAVFAEFALQPALDMQNVPVVGDYRDNYRVNVEQEENKVYVMVFNTQGGEVDSDLNAWVASYDEDGRMIGIIPLSADASDHLTVYSGKVGQAKMQLFLLDGDSSPMIESYWSRDPLS